MILLRLGDSNRRLILQISYMVSLVILEGKLRFGLEEFLMGIEGRMRLI